MIHAKCSVKMNSYCYSRMQMPSPLYSHRDSASPAERMKLPKNTDTGCSKPQQHKVFSIRKLNRHLESCKANWIDAKTSLEITDGDFILHDFFLSKYKSKKQKNCL